MALAVTGVCLELPPSRNLPSIPLGRLLVRPGHLSQRRLRPLSLPATPRISLQLPPSRHRPSIPLSPPRPRPFSISLSATAASAFSSASAAPPLTSRSSHNNQPLEELLETDGSGGNGGSSCGGAGGDHDGYSNRRAALMVPPREWDDWALENPPADSDGSERFFELEKSPLLGWLLRFGGIKERLLADDFFLAKIAIECGLGIFTKNFFKESEIVFADMATAIVADFMLVHLLTSPTASLAPALLAMFFPGYPGNAFQIPFSGSSCSLTQRLGAIAISGGKHYVVGMASSMVRTAVRNALRNVVGKSSGGEVENVPILSTCLAYGVYMAISDNLRSQVLAGVIEQRIWGASASPAQVHVECYPLCCSDRKHILRLFAVD